MVGHISVIALDFSCIWFCSRRILAQSEFWLAMGYHSLTQRKYLICLLNPSLVKWGHWYLRQTLKDMLNIHVSKSPRLLLVKVWSQTSSCSSSWELIRNKFKGLTPDLLNLEAGASDLCFYRSSRRFWCVTAALSNNFLLSSIVRKKYIWTGLI